MKFILIKTGHATEEAVMHVLYEHIVLSDVWGELYQAITNTV
jgi:hypothetical protein